MVSGVLSNGHLAIWRAVSCLAMSVLQRLVEAGADVPDEAQRVACLPWRAVEESQEQRAEMFARAARGRPAADDGVERLRDFDFHPAGAARAGVEAVGALADDALEVVLPRQVE